MLLSDVPRSIAARTFSSFPIQAQFSITEARMVHQPAANANSSPRQQPPRHCDRREPPRLLVRDGVLSSYCTLGELRARRGLTGFKSCLAPLTMYLPLWDARRSTLGHRSGQKVRFLSD